MNKPSSSNFIMKVLFVAQYSPHREKNIPIHVQNQMDQLIDSGANVIPFPFRQNGFKSKLNSYFELKQHLQKNSYDIVHCHFSYIGLAGLLASPKKNVIVSFMGTDLENILKNKKGINVVVSNQLTNLLIRRSSNLVGIIAKNERHYSFLKNRVKCPIINLPNGVDITKFSPGDQDMARNYLNILLDSNLIIFCTAKENNPIKNIELADRAIDFLKRQAVVDFRVLSGLSQEELREYFRAADCLLLTSFSEGSPNVIKEAMACNLPIVATRVGDIPERLKNDDSSYITGFDAAEIAEALNKVIEKKRASKGRELLINEGLDVESTTNKLIKFYNGK